MKKTVLIALCALFTFVACQKTPSAPQTENTEITEIVFKIAVNHSDDTKAVKTGWADGDKVYVFFEGVTGVKYVTLTRSGSDWGATLTGMTAIELATADPANMYAVFFPYEQPVIASDGGSGVTFKTGGHDDAAIDGLSIYSYYMTATSTCTVTDNGDGTATLEGRLNMAIPAGYVQFFINKSSSDYNEDYRYRLSVDGVMPTACVSYSAGTFGTKQLKAAQPMWGYKHGDDGIAFSGVIDATWADDANSHIIYLFDTEAAAKSITISGKTLESHDAVKFTTVASWGPAAIAPTTVTKGVKWGIWNLGGESAATDLGWWFAWGDIVPQCETAGAPSDYGTEAYYQKTVAYEALSGTSAITGDYAIYDMATAFLGPDWRLPSSEELSNLTNGTNQTISTIPGWKVEGVDLFLPITGFFWNGANLSVGDEVYYWASNLSILYVGGLGCWVASSWDTRDTGNPVRPVYIGE